MIATLREPVERVWPPRSTQLAETLNNPLITDLPRRITETMDVVSSLPSALGPSGRWPRWPAGSSAAVGLSAAAG